MNEPDERVSRIPVAVPSIAEGSEDIRVSAWLVDLGQSVIAGDPVVEILIPGITFDIAATGTGKLTEVCRAVDAVVQVGDILGWIELDSTH
jgi:pyruvate/2-oxoglutarate dehydrogenase complex dihydrolipoamide acyltransferase (E2) component